MHINIINNVIYGNSSEGIIGYTDLAKNNIVMWNGSTGIIATEAVGNIVMYNSYGISCQIARNNIVRCNRWVGIRTGGDCVIEGNVISDTGWYGAIYGDTINGVIRENIITRCYRGIIFSEGNPEIRNNVIAGCGLGIASSNGWPEIRNSIFWDNGDDLVSEPWDIKYSLTGEGYPGEGNIDVDPLFRDPENNDFHLMAIECGDSVDSPCIDAGHPDSSDAYLDCQWGLGAERSDMGAYGGSAEPQTDIKEQELIIPRHFILMQNYPNPFNPTTTITFSLPKQQHVTLMIYNLLGREVQTLIDEQRQAGMHTVRFDASELSSAIYFYRLQTGDYSESKRMVLLK